MKEEVAIGIDAGTSNSVIGAFINHKVEIIPNTIGDTFTPSVVEITDDGVAVGEETILHKIDINNEKNLITEIKRIVGRKFSSLTLQEKEKCDIIEDPNNKDQILIKVKRKGKEEFLTPEQILSFIFEKLIKVASDFVRTKISKAVITVPANFDNNQRGAISASAKMAGIEVLRIINEPTSAALAYGLGTLENLKNSLSFSMMQQDKKNKRKVIIFDLGGGTFDVTALYLNDNREFSAIASLGDAHLGGNDFDNKLVDFCIKEFCRSYNINEEEVRSDPNTLRRLKNQCEKAKKKLSFIDQAIISIYNLYKDNNLYIEISREKFDEICYDLYEKIKSGLEQILSESKLTLEEIDDVVLVGGSSRIPKVKEILIEKFGEGKIRDKINPDEAVAIGATWQAHKIMKSDASINILDITPYTIGVAAKSKIPEEIKIGHIMSVLIKKNQKMPCKSNKKYYKTVEDNQKFFKIKIYAGENKFVKDNKLIKEFSLDNLPQGPKGSVQLAINIEIDKDGILSINADVESAGITKTEIYSLYEESRNKTEIVIMNNKKIKGKEQLEEIKKITQFMNKKNENLKKTEKSEEKIEILKSLTKNCSKLIEIYESLSEQNDSDSLYQKLFFNYKRILNYYSQLILLEEDKKNIEDIINKIKGILSKLINDDIESLVNIFSNLKEKKLDEYCIIIIYSADILYQEGDRILKEGKKYSRYYSRKFFTKGDRIKSYINEDIKSEMDYEIEKLYDELEKKYTNKVEQIDAFTKSVKTFIESRESPYIPSGSGFTVIGNVFKKYMESENVDIVLDILSEMVTSLSKDKNNVFESEAFCIFNIIYIKFTILKNQDLNNIKTYENMESRIDYIIQELNSGKNITIKWLSKYEDLKKEIAETKQEELLKKKVDNSEYINELNKVYKEKMEENKPMEFLDFIIQKYPFAGAEKLKEELKVKDLKDKFYEVFPLYSPDNYSGRKDYKIYNEIYMLLVKMEQTLFT